jgi:hypothetical protein
MQTNAPAPWHLTGDGYVLIYKFPQDFAAAHTGAYEYKGGYGAVSLLNYHSSNVGPYQEIMFIPGQVAYPQKTGYSISKIYVSSESSVLNGQTNWGIPKELAEFEALPQVDGSGRIQVCKEGQPFVDLTIKPLGPAIPLNGAVLPPLVQYRNGQTYITRLKSTGAGRYVRILNADVYNGSFPNFTQFTPMMAVKITNFKLTLLEPEILNR